MKRVQSLLALLAAAALSLGLTAYGSGGTSPSAGTDSPAGSGSQAFEVIIGASAEPESLDPQLSGAAAGGNISYNLPEF